MPLSSVETTSDYYLTKNENERYSLHWGGFDDGAEQFGYLADSDEDTIDIAMNYLAHFLVPLQIGEDLRDKLEYEAKTAKTGQP